MVSWKTFIESGSWNQSGSIQSTLGSMSSGQGLDALRSDPNIAINPEYVKLIKEIRVLAMKFDPTMEAVKVVQEILNEYELTGILTQNEMEVLNRIYKVFSFEAKFHPDKATTIGVINEILGGLNGYDI